jgi:hypothetical protein
MLALKILIYIIFTCALTSADDSIVSTPYWKCDRCPDTLIEKVIVRKKPPSIEVYCKISEFRKPSKFFVKTYKNK